MQPYVQQPKNPFTPENCIPGRCRATKARATRGGSRAPNIINIKININININTDNMPYYLRFGFCSLGAEKGSPGPVRACNGKTGIYT